MGEEARPGTSGPALVYQVDGEARLFPIPEGATTLGSARDNDLVLEHESVRPHQVVIMRAGEDVELRDLFAGETRLNGVEQRSGPLRPGDVLALGEVRLRVLRVEVPRDAAAAPEEDTAPSASTGRFQRFQPGDLDEEELERSLFSQDEERDPRDDTHGGTGRFDTAALTAATTPGSPIPPSRDTRRILRERDARRALSLSRARQLSDELRQEPDFERLLERLALSFLEVFAAERAVAVLFEEDGKNPLLTVERCRSGAQSGAGIAPEVVERCLQARTVVRVTGGAQPLDGLAAPLLDSERALGLLYFERPAGPEPLELEDVHLMGLLANQAALVIAPLLAAG